MHRILRKILLSTGVVFILNGAVVTHAHSESLFSQHKLWIGASYDQSKSSQMVAIEGVVNYELPLGIQPTISLSYMKANFNGYIKPK